MKKFILLLFFLICVLLPDTKAQEAKSLWIDMRAGINTSFIINQNAYGNGELDYATTFGFTAGAGAGYFLSDKWGVTTSLTWAKIGQNYSGTQSSGDATRKVRLNYIELPFMAMRKTEASQRPTWIAFGPELMFLTGAKQDYHRENGGTLPKGENMVEGITDIKDRYKPVDVALNLSLNKIYDIYENRKLRMLVSANMAIGLTDINSRDWHTPNLKNKYSGSHNFYIGIKVAVMYRAFIKKE